MDDREKFGKEKLDEDRLYKVQRCKGAKVQKCGGIHYGRYKIRSNRITFCGHYLAA